MSDGYLKCSCRTCGGHIEFPSHAAGMSIGCPNCGATTDLYAAPPDISTAVTPVVAAPGPPPLPRVQTAPAQRSTPPTAPSAAPRIQVAAPPSASVSEATEEFAEADPPNIGSMPAGTNWIGVSLAGVSVLLVVIGGILYLNNVRHGRSVFPSRESYRTAAKASKSASTRASSGDENDAAAATKEKNPAQATTTAPKSLDDLKASIITLQKTPGRNLTYAIGTIRNESDQQRFGVRLELDLLDNAGNKIGVAKDYVRVIEPRQEWRFRAMVLASKTASARVGKITEQE